MYNPRLDSWEEHFHLEENGRIQPLTGIGRVTSQLLRFNTPERISERRLLYELLKSGVKFD